MQTATCSICEEKFIAVKMVGEKCEACHIRFPNVKNKAELAKKRESKGDYFNKGNFENRVKEQVEQILEEHRILIRCGCGGLYNKRGPKQIKCPACREVEIKGK